MIAISLKSNYLHLATRIYVYEGWTDYFDDWNRFPIEQMKVT